MLLVCARSRLMKVSHMNSTFQRRLLITTALPLAIASAASVQARDVVVPAPVAPATSVPGAAVNALIVQAISAPDDRNLKVTVPIAGVVTGNSITLNPGVNQGDGAVELVNDGSIGKVDAATNTITDGAGVVFNGRSVAGNLFTGTNNGLIAGGLRAELRAVGDDHQRWHGAQRHRRHQPG